MPAAPEASPPGSGGPHLRKRFARARLPVDGERYVECEFRDCTFVFLADGREGEITGCRLTGRCTFEYGGAAALTIGKLALLYNDEPDKRPFIEALFEAIRSGQDPRGLLRVISWSELRGPDTQRTIELFSQLYRGLAPAGPLQLEELFEQIRGRGAKGRAS